MKAFLAAALAFGGLVLATPVAAYLLRAQLNDRGLVSVLTFLGLGGVLLALCVVCLALFGRAARVAFRLPVEPTDQPPAMAALMTAFAFDADDLEANRQRRLSSRQRVNLRASNQAMVIMGTVMIGVTYLFLAFMPWMMGDTAASGDDGQIGLVIGGVLITLLLLVSVVRGYWQMRGQVHGWVREADGVAAPPVMGGDSAATRSVRTSRVGPLAVPLVSGEQARALQPGVRYRVYYLPGPLPRVLSVDAEAVPTDAARS
jgi:MFS family permease